VSTHDPWWRRRHELRLSLDPELVDRCSDWLQRPRGDLSPAAWLAFLQPEHLDSALRLPDGTLHLAAELRWAMPATLGDFEVMIEPVWAVRHGRSTELAIDVHARRSGQDVASLRGVYRVPGDQEPFGERTGPPSPSEPVAQARSVRLTLDSAQVEAFASISDTGHPLHDDAGYAHQQGYPGVLVQGLLLAATVMHHAQPGPSGTARFWFHRPVSAGTLLRLEGTEPEDGRSRWWVRKPTGEVAAEAEIEGPRPS
jgi:acyl dehydratase